MHREQSEAFGKRLRQVRVAAGFSQDGAAKALHVSRQAVSAWERGVALPNLSQLCEVAQLWGSSLDWLVFGIKTVPVSKKPVMASVFPTQERQSEPSDT